MTTPKNEPLQLRAGDTWAWRREDLTDYPAPTWVLTYYFKAPTANFSIAAAADGAAHAVSVAKATTAGRTATRYKWTAAVDNGTERHVVDQGELVVLPDFAASGNLDDRSHARKMLDAIQALLEGRATKDQQSYTVGDISITRIPVEQLTALRDKYRTEVATQRRLERLKAGGVVQTNLPVRFA